MDTKICSKCKQEKSLTEFYSHGGKNHTPHSYCKQCFNIDVLERQRKIKHEIVMYKGGRCNICGYNKYEGALEFHHIDPKEKDFDISHSHLISFIKIKPELNKCICLCANCHREIHANILSISDIKSEYCISIEPEIKQKKKKINYCIDCGEPLKYHTSKRCRQCDSKNKSKIDWPDIKTLKELLTQYGNIELGRKLGINPRTISKHIKKYE